MVVLCTAHLRYEQELVEWEREHGDHIATVREAQLEYADNAGRERPDSAWISTPWDTWEHNPHYVGPPVPHPEDDEPRCEQCDLPISQCKEADRKLRAAQDDNSEIPF